MGWHYCMSIQSSPSFLARKTEVQNALAGWRAGICNAAAHAGSRSTSLTDQKHANASVCHRHAACCIAVRVT